MLSVCVSSKHPACPESQIPRIKPQATRQLHLKQCYTPVYSPSVHGWKYRVRDRQLAPQEGGLSQGIAPGLQSPLDQQSEEDHYNPKSASINTQDPGPGKLTGKTGI